MTPEQEVSSWKAAGATRDVDDIRASRHLADNMPIILMLWHAINHVDDLAEDRAKLPTHRLDAKVIIRRAICELKDFSRCTCH